MITATVYFTDYPLGVKLTGDPRLGWVSLVCDQSASDDRDKGRVILYFSHANLKVLADYLASPEIQTIFALSGRSLDV